MVPRCDLPKVLDADPVRHRSLGRTKHVYSRGQTGADVFTARLPPSSRLYESENFTIPEAVLAITREGVCFEVTHREGISKTWGTNFLLEI